MFTIESNGVTIAYDDRGDGPPVLLICGGGMRSSGWKTMGTRRALHDAGYRTICFENRGVVRRSAPPPPYTVEEMVGDTIGLLEHLELRDCLVHGSSLGALVAQSLALQRPELVQALNLHVAGGNFSALTRHRLAVSLDCLRVGGEVAVRQLRVQTLELALTPSERDDPALVASRLAHWGLLADAVPEQAMIDLALGQLSATHRWAGEDHLGELEGMKQPCLVSGHEFDELATVATRRQAAEAIPDSELLIIPNAAHMPSSRAALAEWTQTMIEFFDRHR